MYKLTAADFADTGQWRLILRIYESGLEAVLENTLHPEIEPQLLCNVNWAEGDDKILKNLEEAVYNNPRLLDDFATKIIIYSLRTLFVPTEIAEMAANSEEDLYRKVFDVEPGDIMTDTDRDLTAIWSLGKGVKPFLLRTFPGARLTCNLLDKVRDIRKGLKHLQVNTGQMRGEVEFYKEERATEVDLILMKGKDLISASTHPYRDKGEIKNLEEKMFRCYDDISL